MSIEKITKDNICAGDYIVDYYDYKKKRYTKYTVMEVNKKGFSFWVNSIDYGGWNFKKGYTRFMFWESDKLDEFVKIIEDKKENTIT